MNTSIISEDNMYRSQQQQLNNGLHLSAISPPEQKAVTRSEIGPYPTTFVQADPSSFKQVVQMLTGTSETAKQASLKVSPEIAPTRTQIPLMKNGQRKFKLFERRSSCMKGLKLSPLLPGMANNPGFSPRKQEMLSPSMLDFPALVLSPVTPLIPDPFNRPLSRDTEPGSDAEIKAITEKGFYLHPSPTSTPMESEPKLLPLFPLTSPRHSSTSSSSSPGTHSS